VRCHADYRSSSGCSISGCEASVNSRNWPVTRNATCSPMSTRYHRSARSDATRHTCGFPTPASACPQRPQAPSASSRGSAGRWGRQARAASGRGRHHGGSVRPSPCPPWPGRACPVGAENPVHLLRPGHTHGSARRVDPAARRVRWPLDRDRGRLRGVALDRVRGAAGAGCGAPGSPPALSRDAADPRSASGRAAHAVRCRSSVRRTHSLAVHA
jgi:hypothetical protein